MLLPRCLMVFWLIACAASADDIRLIGYGETWRFFKGESEPATNGVVRWFEEGYADAGWASGRSGFGTPGVYGEVTQFPHYGSSYRTVYFRKEFAVRDTSSIADLILRVDYDDGFVAYLNGQEIARRGVPGEPGNPVPVAATAAAHARGVGELIPLNTALPLLRPGTNLLAVQILGSSTNDWSMAFNPEVLANVIRGPYVQNTTPSSTEIIWKTFSPAPSAVEFGTNITQLQRVFVSTNGTEHEAKLSGLEADTIYFYRLVNRFGEKGTVSDWRSFRTFKNSGPVTFNVVGDSGWGSTPQLMVAEQMERSPADFLMHVGDMVYYAITHNNADLRLFSVYTKEMQSRPWFLAVGNHDLYVDPKAALQCFYLPTNSVTGTEHFYSFDHGDVHFAVAWSDVGAGSTYHPGSPQYDWLDADLRSSTKPWKFLFFHHGWRTSSTHQADDYDRNLVMDMEQLDAGLAEVARRNGVQIIFNGHDHCYERLAPSGGPISFVSGGGGASIYPMRTPHPDSVQFHGAYHFLRVHVEGNEARVEAVGLDGAVFDQVHLRRSFPERAANEATWNTPIIETAEANDMDGNLSGQRFDFTGEPLNGPMGLFSSAGRLFVNNDNTNLYLGFDEVMLRAGEELFLFVELPALMGRTNMAQFGNGLVDPSGEAVDALDFISNLAFTNFSPSIAVVLGDEFADGYVRDFLRHGCEIGTGQGAYYLTDETPAVEAQRLTQFNRSPQLAAMLHEQNADYVELALPFSALGGLKPGDVIRVGAVTALQSMDTNAVSQSRQIDSGGIGHSVTTQGGLTVLEGIEVRLARLPDADGDGLSDEEEVTRQTQLTDSDSDDDGMTDGWELLHQFNPLVADGTADADADGLTNEMEERAGTDPNSAASGLTLGTEPAGDGGWRLTWRSVPGKRYKVECRDTLAEPFRDVADGLFPRVAQGPRESFRIDLSPDAPQNSRYYRVQLVD